MATEKLKFKLELYAIMWDRPPSAQILIGDKSYFDGEITGKEDNPTVIEFEHELQEGNEYDLVIKRYGKQGKNTLTNTDTDHGVVWPEQIESQTIADEKGNIIKDQTLHIKNIEIDEIDIGALVYEGVYTPKYTEPWATQHRESGNDLRDSFKNVTQMGFDGEWKFTFSSPFYMWLLENLY
jgi:hypothetical protein